jgi:hypothetical protein
MWMMTVCVVWQVNDDFEVVGWEANKGSRGNQGGSPNIGERKPSLKG